MLNWPSFDKLSTVFGLVVFLLAGHYVEGGMKVKWVCFGDEFKLECPMMNLLLIHLTSVSIPPTNSNLCSKRNETSIPCGLVPYSQSLKTECNGRQKCILKKNESELTNAKCKQRFVVSVIYECTKVRVNTTVPTVLTKTATKSTAVATKEVNNTQTTITYSTDWNRNVTISRKKVDTVTYLFYTLFSATMALQYMQGRPKHVILCVVLSVSAGIVLLIIVILIMACIERVIEESKKEEANALEISLPLLVSGTAPTAATTQLDSCAPSENSSGEQQATLPRIQSFRTCHSVDEGTQTEPELDEACSVENGLSDNEAKELGYLVDIMRYYNSNLDSMPPASESLDFRSETPSMANTPSMATRTELSYTGPRIVDTSRRRQPRLSSATYSSSNNSENGDASVFLPSPTVKQNHIDTQINSISTLPRRRPNLVAKYNTFGQTTNSLRHYDSPKLMNGPKRLTSRARIGFADEAPNHHGSGRLYGTLS